MIDSVSSISTIDEKGIFKSKFFNITVICFNFPCSNLCPYLYKESELTTLFPAKGDFIFLLSKQNLDLSKEEVLQLFNIKNYKLIDNLLITKKTNQKLFFRLAYTKFIYEYLFEGTDKYI